MQLGFSAPQAVLDVIAAMGRTEDIRFSPDRRRLAVAAMPRQRIVLFDIEVQATPAGKRIHLSAAVELHSSELREPHGLDFIDNDTLAVANREGDLVLFRLPPRVEAGVGELLALRRFASCHPELQGPSAVTFARLDPHQLELFVCRSQGNRVSRHLVSAAGDFALVEEQVLLDRWVESPNAISVSRSQRWLALSSLNIQGVLVYPRPLTAQPEPMPQALLRGACDPHGLRFSDDDRYLVVADAGAPYVHIYFQPDGQWGGVYDPSLSLRVMDDPLFQLRNSRPPLKGGPKGVDIDCAAGILVTTCLTQPLAFFDLSPALEATLRQGPWARLDASASAAGDALDVLHELTVRERQMQVARDLADAEQRLAHTERQLDEARQQVAQAEALRGEAAARAACAEARVQALLASRSWRITAPLRRWLSSRRSEA